MSSKKRKPSSPSKAKAAPRSAPTPAVKRWRAARLWPAYLAAVVALAAATWWWQSTPESAAPTATPSPTAVLRLGGVTGCRANPQYARSVGLSSRIHASTQERTIKGMVLFDTTVQEVKLGAPGVYQHPSWDDFGHLGPVTTDGDGNTYTAPTPRISLYENPPDDQNTVLKVDTQTGVMAPLVDLPRAAPATEANPFGVLGLAYDCDTGSLYASSVAGSARSAELGRIYRLDPATGEVLSQLDQVDAMGLAVFNGARGKRLYFGSARLPEIRSVALDGAGNFAGDLRSELSLVTVPPGLDMKARRIAFDPTTNDMLVHGVEFAFNLVAMSETRQADYRFSYDAASDSWQPAAPQTP